MRNDKARKDKDNKGQTAKILWLGVGAFLLSSIFINLEETSQTAYALTQPNQVAPDTGTTPTNYVFELLDNSPINYIYLNSNFYSDPVYIYGNHANFTNTALSAAANHVQTFGIGSPDSNLTLSGINVASVVVGNVDCPAATNCNVLYYYDASYPVTTVKVTSLSGSVIIPSNSFYTNAASFNAASAPAVYKNATGGYVQVKAAQSATLSTTFYFSPNEATTVYVDLGSSKSVVSFSLTQPNAALIPSTVQVYVTNNVSSLTSVTDTITPNASTGTQTFTLSSITSGRYIVLKVTDWGTATSWAISDFSARTLENSAALQAQEAITSNVNLILNIASFGLVIFALLVIFGDRLNLSFEM